MSIVQRKKNYQYVGNNMYECLSDRKSFVGHNGKEILEGTSQERNYWQTMIDKARGTPQREAPPKEIEVIATGRRPVYRLTQEVIDYLVSKGVLVKRIDMSQSCGFRYVESERRQCRFDDALSAAKEAMASMGNSARPLAVDKFSVPHYPVLEKSEKQKIVTTQRLIQLSSYVREIDIITKQGVRGHELVSPSVLYKEELNIHSQSFCFDPITLSPVVHFIPVFFSYLATRHLIVWILTSLFCCWRDSYDLFHINYLDASPFFASTPPRCILREEQSTAIC